MKSKDRNTSDLQLAALMIARQLKSQHGFGTTPALSDYSLVESPLYPSGGCLIRTDVKIERGVTINVDQFWWGDAANDLDTLVATATKMADKIAKVHRERLDILKMFSEVRETVRREVGKARRRGLAYRVISVQPASTEHDHDRILIDVVIERLAETLRPERARMGASCSEDIVDAIASWEEKQSFRSLMHRAMKQQGATGQIDVVVLNAIREAGHDVREVLSSLGSTDDWIVDVGQKEEGPKRFRLYWRDGQVLSTINLGGGASWHDGTLRFDAAPIALKGLKGRRVCDLVSNQVFGETMRVSSASGKKGEGGTLYCTTEMLNFDSDTGRLWAA